MPYLIFYLQYYSNIFHESEVWQKITILFSQSQQDCFWKFLQDIEVLELYFHECLKTL